MFAQFIYLKQINNENYQFGLGEIFRIAIIQVSTIRITRKNLFMRDWSLDHSILSINKLLREIPFKNYEWMKNYE